MKMLIADFLNDDSGATAIEYALMSAGIGFAILISITTVGANISTMLTYLMSQLP